MKDKELMSRLIDYCKKIINNKGKWDIDLAVCGIFTVLMQDIIEGKKLPNYVHDFWHKIPSNKTPESYRIIINMAKKFLEMGDLCGRNGKKN